MYKYRKKAKLTEEELAAKLQVKSKMIAYWEKDQLMPKEKHFQNIVRFLKIPEKEVLEPYVIRRESHHLESAGMMLIFVLIAILGSFLLPIYEQNGAAFLFKPQLDLSKYILSYISLWLYFISAFSMLLILIKFLVNATVTKQKKLFVMLRVPLAVMTVSVVIPMLEYFFLLKMGYFSILTFTLVFLIIYILKYRKMRKTLIIGEEA